MAASDCGQRFGTFSLRHAGEYIPLLGKQCLRPVDYCAHAGGAAQIAVPTSDSLSLGPYAGQLTINGELNKPGRNVSFGHGIHAGIHWRSDIDTSLLLGEAVALSFLRDRTMTSNEPFTVQLTKFDGTTATISNQ